MERFANFVLLFVFMLFFVCSSYGEVSDTHDNEIIERYEKNLALFKNISFHGTYNYSYGTIDSRNNTVENTKTPPLTCSTTIKREYYITPNEVWVSDDIISHERNWRRTGESLYQDSLRIGVSVLNEDAVKMKYTISAEDLVFKDERLSNATMADFLKKQARFAIPLGYIPFKDNKDTLQIQYIPDILRQLKISNSKSNTVLFRGVWKDYETEISFDTQTCVPHTVILKKSRPIFGSSQPFYLEHKLSYDNVEFPCFTTKIVSIEKSDKAIVERPTEDFLSTRKVEIPSRYVRVEMTFDHVQCPVKQSRQKIKMYVPNGTEVYYAGKPQIKYIWLNGKIILKTDEAMEKVIQSLSFATPQARWFRSLFFVLGLLLICIALFAFYRSMKWRKTN